MSEPIFSQHQAGDGGGLGYWEAGSGEAIVAILGSTEPPTRAHALMAEHRRVVVFAMPGWGEAPRQQARAIAAAVAGLGIARFDLIGEGTGAAAALWLALDLGEAVGAVVLAAPDGPADDAFRDITQPVLVLCGTRDGLGGGDRYRALLRDGHFMLVYDAGSAIGGERPEALTFIAREFFERRDLFLVSRESGITLP
ncbi:MAG: alpha/beta fold hydrolase [Stellaceae bacterium]|jgi:pimeloyl-ACP methyl ester carboxylesterase